MVAGFTGNSQRRETSSKPSNGAWLVEQRPPSQNDLATADYIKETYEKVEVEKL